MLVTDDSGGKADGKERDQLTAITETGSEFITFNDFESTVQKSGEFARITKESSDPQPRFVLIHEPTQVYDKDWNDYTGNELLNLPPGVELRKRSHLYVSEVEESAGDLPFREIAGYKTYTRIPRHRGPGDTNVPTKRPAMHEANYTAQAGKRRLFPVGDGTLLMLREVVAPNDNRFFNDSMRTLLNSPQPHTKKRGLRAARVEVVELDPINGKTSDPIFSFDIHSGLGFDPTPRTFSNAARSTADMYNTTTVFGAFSGVLFGSSLNLPSVVRVPAGGDASDTYAVAEPAVAKSPEGKEYTSIVAVYPGSDDVYNPISSGPYRLTCKRTTPNGDVAYNKINFPALPHIPLHYLAARGMSLHRLTPTKVALRVNVHLMQYGAGGSSQSIASDAFFMWTGDNGETWTYNPVAAGFPGVFPYGGMLVKDKDTLLAFSWYNEAGSSQPVQVHRINSAGTARIATIPASVFGGGLMKAMGTSGWQLVPYVPIGFGGAIYRRGDDKKVTKRLWMQFDPYWGYAQDTPEVLQYPGSRPMLLVSDDGGITWTRRLLPSPWCFRVGFVVSIDSTTLAVPVCAPRKDEVSPLPATIYLSKDGGDTWKATGARVVLSPETYVDGQITQEGQYTDQRGQLAFKRDLVDSALQFNRGELLPLIALRGTNGKPLPANPARPWMTHYKFTEPEHG